MYESSHEEAIRMEREVNENASEDIRQHSYILPFGFSISARAFDLEESVYTVQEFMEEQLKLLRESYIATYAQLDEINPTLGTAVRQYIAAMIELSQEAIKDYMERPEGSISNRRSSVRYLNNRNRKAWLDLLQNKIDQELALMTRIAAPLRNQGLYSRLVLERGEVLRERNALINQLLDMSGVMEERERIEQVDVPDREIPGTTMYNPWYGYSEMYEDEIYYPQEPLPESSLVQLTRADTSNPESNRWVISLGKNGSNDIFLNDRKLPVTAYDVHSENGDTILSLRVLVVRGRDTLMLSSQSSDDTDRRDETCKSVNDFRVLDRVLKLD